jgi:hypothetical protein
METGQVPEQKQPVKLALCIPNLGDWQSDFGMSMLQMCVYISATLFEEGQDRQVIVVDRRTSMLPRSRQESLESALHQGCTHALFVDTDQTFPRDLCHRLMAWKKPVVACNIALKVLPSFPTARARGATAFGVPITSEAPKTGLEKVWRVGAGIMLVDLSILKNVPKPWFEIHYSAKNEQFVGEDWFFVGRLEAAGIDVYIDHELSRQVGHVGQYIYSHANIPTMQAIEAA